MSVKSKAWDYLQKIKEGDIGAVNSEYILIALIKNGVIHADEVWNSEKLIEAYESVMGEGEEEE